MTSQPATTPPGLPGLPGLPGTPRQVDVLIVGAGLSGIGAAYRIQEQCPDRTFALLDRRAAVGGTWDLFRYPGIRSDSDIASFSYVFKPWRGDGALADGAGIRRYAEEAVDEFGLRDRIAFNTRVVRASWSSADALWTVDTVVTDEAGTREEQWTASFLYSCTGYYNYDRGLRPVWEGEDDFTAAGGRLVHPQFWPEDLDTADKRVVIIGSGATAVTLVPELARTAAHVTMLQRSPTWMVSLPGHDPVASALRRRLPARTAHRVIRAKNIGLNTAFYQFCRLFPRAASRMLTGEIAKVLGVAAVHDHFTPAYRPWDQRLCVMPDGDLLQAVRSGRASVVTDTIDRFVPGGIRLRGGEVVEADLVVTATGLELLAFGGMELAVDGRPVDLAETFAYRGLMISGLPNFALAVGYVNASWTLRSDLIARYVCRLLNLMSDRGYVAATPVAPAGMRRRPLLDLSSTYVLRAIDGFPKQGDRKPWVVTQNYLRELRELTRADLTQDMRFTSRAVVEASRRLATAGGRGATAGGRDTLVGGAPSDGRSAPAGPPTPAATA